MIDGYNTDKVMLQLEIPLIRHKDISCIRFLMQPISFFPILPMQINLKWCKYKSSLVNGKLRIREVYAFFIERSINRLVHAEIDIPIICRIYPYTHRNVNTTLTQTS